MWVHQDQHQWKICSEDPIMVKQVVSGCPEEENKSEMKSNQVQPCSILLHVDLSKFQVPIADHELYNTGPL